MRRLMLLRHAKADRPAGVRDEERALSPRGRDSSAEVGAYMARHGLRPDLAVVSPSTRTRETWTLLAPAFGKSPPARFEERLYEADAEDIIDVARETPGKVHTLLVVGHNPGFHEVANTLIASGDVEARERLNERFPTAALVVIDLPFDDWTRIHRASGRLDRFIAPRDLDPTTD